MSASCAVCLNIGCTDGRVETALSQIDTLMEAHPDSALLLLDSLKGEKSNWPKSLRMRFDLLETKAQNKAFVDFTSDSIAKDFTDYYDSHGSANERMMAHYLLGCVYRDIGEAPHAVDCYLNAISRADTTAQNCDFYTLSCAYAQMADIYHLQLLLSNEISARIKASYYASCAHNIYYSIYNKERIAGAYILMNRKDSAELILKNVIDLYRQNHYFSRALQASVKLIHIYLDDSCRLSDAKKLMDKYENESGFFNNNNKLPNSKRQYHYYKGMYYDSKNVLDSAEYYYRKIGIDNNSYSAQDPTYRGLLSVFSKRHQTDSIAKYAQLYCLANDSSIAKKDQDLTAQMAASYNYHRYKKEAFDNEKKAHRTQLILIAVLISIVLMSLLVYVKWRSNIKEKERLRIDFTHAIEEYEKNLRTIQFMDTAYQEVISAIKEKLNKSESENRVKLETITFEYERKKAELEEENRRLSESIRSMEQEKVISDRLKTTYDFMSTEVVKHIKELEQKPLSMLKEDDWSQLNAEMAFYFPNILYDLNALSKISDQKIRVCLLVVLKIQDGCIANWLELKPNRISNIKSELNYDLFGESSARSLYNNLRQKYNIIST